ncbi:hypothetical protein FB451DRAFT_1386057 [Mycena latifolia]|nr:hypothetical protein FB451DRAFT_1386057 [Mycena latifolia]
MCASISTNFIVRDDPYASITGSVPGLARPTATDSTIVGDYGQAIQKCGPDLNTALQELLPMFGPETGIDNPNVNATDPQFLTWARLQSTYQLAELRCEDWKGAVIKDEALEQTSSGSTDSTAASSVPTTQAISSDDASVSSSAAPRTTEQSLPSVTGPSPSSTLRSLGPLADPVDLC